MRKKSKVGHARLTKVGGPPAGSVAALAIGQSEGATLFAGTQVGLFRLEDGQGADADAGEWERLANAPLGILCLAVSPAFAQDQTVVAGNNSGIFTSRDAGETWLAAELPLSSSVVIAISFSPNYQADGILLAGTMEDGIFYSNSRGLRWQSNGFGLLDPAAYCLGFSPSFDRDTTVFAGTDTTVYFSYNGALAWKQLDFPESAAPALSLAVSLSFDQDQTLYVGTEQQGLYRSADRGRTWQRLDLPAECVNALAVSQFHHALLAATEVGIFASSDQGQTWSRLLDAPNVISLATAGETTVAGVVGQGVRLVTHPAERRPIPNLAARSVLGLALSAQFDQQPIAFMFGPQEGLWRTTDGGRHWDDLGGELPSADISALVLAPDFSTRQVAIAASPAGVLVSADAGSHWARVTEEPANLLAYSPNGQVLAVSFASGAIRETHDLGQTWLPVPGPWDIGAKVLALAVDDSHRYYVAFLKGAGKLLSLWQGKPGDFDLALSRAVGENPLVSLLIPSTPAAEPAWYAAYGNLVWKFGVRKGQRPAESIVFPAAGTNESIVALTGVHNETGEVLLAGTGTRVFKMSSTEAWRNVLDLGHERAVALAVSPTYLKDKLVYGLLLGGTFCQVVIA